MEMIMDPRVTAFAPHSDWSDWLEKRGSVTAFRRQQGRPRRRSHRCL